jgi:hypothetical protein
MLLKAQGTREGTINNQGPARRGGEEIMDIISNPYLLLTAGCIALAIFFHVVMTAWIKKCTTPDSPKEIVRVVVLLRNNRVS